MGVDIEKPKMLFGKIMRGGITHDQIILSLVRYRIHQFKSQWRINVKEFIDKRLHPKSIEAQ